MRFLTRGEGSAKMPASTLKMLYLKAALKDSF